MTDESIKRERFGRYLILDHLVDGGMAKISRARFLGEQADKVVAIKMVQPQFSRDEAFKTMFMDEIKVTFGLSHPNVIQTSDYGIHAGQLFVAMEYCDGRNLKEFIEKLKERKFVFPVEISIYIISQACQGLYYAHTFRDKLTGIASSIIHRDISPHNIMMSYDGAVKIIDFGIAKSSTNSEATQAGTIKGKLSYLAPEYLEGLELDARYDQFALGITLWEMLCNRKLFKENNDLAILKKIQECKVPPPSSINPNVPKELDEIVLKALSKDRTKRYDNLDLMNRALMKILYAKFPDFNATDLAFFAQELFREEIKKDREKLFEYGRINIKPYIDDLKNELEKGTSNPSKEISAAAKAQAQQTPDKAANNMVFEFDFEKEQSIDLAGKVKKVAKKVMPAKAEEPKSGKPLPEKPGAVNLDPSQLGIKTKTKTKTNAIENKVKVPSDKTTKTKVVIPTESEKKSSSFSTIAALLAVVVGAGAYYGGFIGTKFKKEVVQNTTPKNVETAKKGHAPASVVVEEKATIATLVLTHFDKLKMQVFIDGTRTEPDTLMSIKVPIHKEFTLRVQIEGRKHFIKVMTLENSDSVETEIPDMPSAMYGYMNTSSACAEGTIKFEVFGEKRQTVLPLKQNFGVALPLHMDEKNKPGPQKYMVEYIKNGETEGRKIEITVSREDQSIDLCEIL